MNGRGKVLVEFETAETGFSFEVFFRAQYGRVAGAIARVIRDPARSEELAVEIFWKLWRRPRAQGEKAAAADLAQGAEDDIKGTPTIVVIGNGKRQAFGGVRKFELLKSYLDEVLGTQ